MRKLVRESLFEKFTEKSDPIKDMGIGWEARQKWYDEQYEKTWKLDWMGWDPRETWEAEDIKFEGGPYLKGEPKVLNTSAYTYDNDKWKKAYEIHKAQLKLRKMWRRERGLDCAFLNPSDKRVAKTDLAHVEDEKLRSITWKMERKRKKIKN